MVTLHRVTKPQIFQLPYNFHIILILLSLPLIYYNYRQNRTNIIVIFLLPLLQYFLGFEYGIPYFSLILSVYTFYHYPKKREQVQMLFKILTVIYIPVMINWTLFRIFNFPGILAEISAVETGVYSVISLANPVVTLVFFFYWVFDPFKKQFTPGILSHEWGAVNLGETLLSISLILVVFGSIYPHMSGINPESRFVGVDVPRYIRGLDNVSSNVSFILEAAWGSRPLLFFFLYIFKTFTRWDSSFIIQFIPLILNPLLIYTVYYLSSELGMDSSSAGLASFFTACGMNITVGLYSHFIANILALIFANTAIIFLIRAYNSNNRHDLVNSVFFSILLNFTHPYTFFQYMGILFFSALFHIFVNNEHQKAAVFLKYSIPLMFVEFVKLFLIIGVTGGSVTNTAVGKIVWFSRFWWQNFFSLQILYGGYLPNIIYTFFAIFGLIYLKRDTFETVFLNFVVLTPSLFYLIGNETIKGRLLFNTPLGILASIGFMNLFSRDNSRKDILPFLILFSIVVLFRSLANLI